MAGRRSKNKGKGAEREFFALLNEQLGYEAFKRNLDQTREGGADSLTDLPVAVEVKRQERLLLTPWIRQALEQGRAAGKTPVLAYRRSREPWTVLVAMTPEEFVHFLKWHGKGPI